MKTKYYFILVLFFVFFSACTRKYQEKIDKYNYFLKNKFLLSSDYLDYYIDNGFFPETNEIYDYILNTPDLLEYNSFIFDPFSNKKATYKYIPVYDKNTKRSNSFILLSTGIDCEINNIIEDSLFKEDISGLKIYDNSNYSFFNTIFGKKDLLFLYISGYKFMLLYTHEFNPDSLFDYLSIHSSSSIIRYKTSINKIKIQSTKEYDFIITDGQYKIKNILYNKNDLIKILQTSQDSICFIGIKKELDTNSNEITFNNVIIAEDSLDK